MSYDPSHRKPPRQQRWPSATPAEGWPSYRDGDAYPGHEQADGRPATDRHGGYLATAGYRQTAGYQSSVVTDTFPSAGGGYGGAADGYGGYGYQAGGYPGSGFSAVTDGFDGAADGYGWADSGYGRADNDYASGTDGYGWADSGYGRADNEYANGADGYAWDGNGYDGAADGFTAHLGPGSYTEYAEPASADPELRARDVGVHPGSWRADQDSRRAATQRGMLVGAVTEVLGIAVAIGVSTLAAALLRTQASPAAAMGGVFIDRLPASLRNAVIQHFGASGRPVLLLGMFAAIAFIALVIGVLARRAAALGVAGVAAFTLFAAFVVVTRPAGHASDVMPAIVGGVAGVMALLWLVRASAPPQGITPLRHSHGGARRRAR